MNLIELERSLRQLRLGGMAAVLETRLRQAQSEPMAPLDLIASLVSDELTRRMTLASVIPGSTVGSGCELAVMRPVVYGL
jgi:hypothetical protein